MPVGKVKWFNNAKGYGFIRMENEERDIFVHYSSILMNGFKTLAKDERVRFELREGPKGLYACACLPIADEDVQEDAA